MSVRIRLSRIGKKHVPFFRVVAVDCRRKRDSAFLANIGTYDALNTKIVRFDEVLYQEWIEKGALPTDSAKKIYTLFKKGTEVPAPKKKVEKKAKPSELAPEEGPKPENKKKQVEASAEVKVKEKTE